MRKGVNCLNNIYILKSVLFIRLIKARNLLDHGIILARSPCEISLTRRNAAIIKDNIGGNLTAVKFGHYNIRKYFKFHLLKKAGGKTKDNTSTF
jgi:hypothetical protein